MTALCKRRAQTATEIFIHQRNITYILSTIVSILEYNAMSATATSPDMNSECMIAIWLRIIKSRNCWRALPLLLSIWKSILSNKRWDLKMLSFIGKSLRPKRVCENKKTSHTVKMLNYYLNIKMKFPHLKKHMTLKWKQHQQLQKKFKNNWHYSKRK